MEASRSERPRRQAAIRSQEKSRSRAILESSTDTDSSVRFLKLVPPPTTNTTTKTAKKNDVVVVVERPESPQMYGPTQTSQTLTTAPPARRRASPSKRLKEKEPSPAAYSSASKSNVTLGADVKGHKSHSSSSGSSRAIIRRTRSTKESSSSKVQQEIRRAKQLLSSSEDEDDLFVQQENTYYIRETRSKSKSKVEQQDKQSQSTKNHVDSKSAVATTKKTPTSVKSQKQIPSTVVLSDEEDETDSETQFPLLENVGLQRNCSSSSPTAGEVTAVDDIGVDNIVQSILEGSVRSLQKTSSYLEASAAAAASATEIIQDTPPASSASPSPRASFKTRPLRFPQVFTSSAAANRQKQLTENLNTLGVASESHNEANLSQDLFTSTQFNETEDFGGDSAIGDTVDVDTFRSSPVIVEDSRPQSSSSTQPKSSSLLSLDQNSNSNSRDSESSVVTVIKSAVKRPALFEPVDEDDSVARTFTNTLPLGSPKKHVQSEEESFTVDTTIFIKHKRSPYIPKMRLTSTKRSVNALKINKLNMSSPVDKRNVLAKPTPVSKTLRNTSMRDSGDYFIASASIPSNNIENNKDDTMPEDSSEVDLSGVVDQAGFFQDSITYEDPSIVTTLGFEPLRKCGDLINQQLLLKLSTNASVGQLENTVRVKGLKTVGDLCSLDVLNIRMLPIAPSLGDKLETFRKIMASYAQQHYPNVLSLSQNEQESPKDENLNQVQLRNMVSLPVGQDDNQNTANDGLDGDTPGVVVEPSTPDIPVDLHDVQGSDQVGIAIRVEQEPIAPEDRLGFVIKFIEEKLTAEERKQVLIKLFNDNINSN